MIVTKEQALELPFDGYMQWCRAYLSDSLKKSPSHSAVIGSILDAGGLSFFEAQWAKTYWFNQCAKLSVGG